MRMTRRDFLRTTAAAAATAALPPAFASAAATFAAATSSVSATSIEHLRRLVQQRALASEDPWVLMHVLLALGPDTRTKAGPILDQVMAQHLAKVERGGQSYVWFPLNVEAHPNHFLEIMDAVAVPSSRKFATPAGQVGTAELLQGAKALMTPTIAGPELSWTLSVFTAAMRPDADRFTSAEGQAFTVAALVETAAQAAEVGYADTLAAMRGTKAYGRSVLQTYACNGSHVLYGLYDALRHGYEGKDLRARVRKLTVASYFRLGAEAALIDQALAAPEQQLNADAAKLQFLGHSIENLRYAERHGIYAASATERQQLATAEAQLAAVVHRIATIHNLDVLANDVPRAYRIILGDACHALHGLTSL
jgi:hypothetical protein